MYFYWLKRIEMAPFYSKCMAVVIIFDVNYFNVNNPE